VARNRFPRSVYRHGSEPDPRFSLANERTFLAWIRTSLALIACGVGVHALHLEIPEQLGDVTAVVLVVMGVAAAVQAWVGWMRNERAMREGRPLQGAVTAAVLTAVLVVTTVLLAVAIFVL
jgi:putative membrane protein